MLRLSALRLTEQVKHGLLRFENCCCCCCCCSVVAVDVAVVVAVAVAVAVVAADVYSMKTFMLLLLLL